MVVSSFVGTLRSLPLPDSSCASQHLLLFISALIPKALASLLTSFTVALSGNEQVQYTNSDKSAHVDKTRQQYTTEQFDNTLRRRHVSEH